MFSWSSKKKNKSDKISSISLKKQADRDRSNLSVEKPIKISTKKRIQMSPFLAFFVAAIITTGFFFFKKKDKSRKKKTAYLFKYFLCFIFIFFLQE